MIVRSNEEEYETVYSSEDPKLDKYTKEEVETNKLSLLDKIKNFFKRKEK